MIYCCILLSWYRKWSSGSLVGEMVSHMQQYQQYKGDPEKVKKMYLYSAVSRIEWTNHIFGSFNIRTRFGKHFSI